MVINQTIGEYEISGESSDSLRVIHTPSETTVGTFTDEGFNNPTGGGSGGDVGDRFVVTDYGATGDGTTDDTTAIQDAVDAAESNGHGVVYFPDGEYYVSSTIDSVNDNIVFRGEDSRESVLLGNGLGPTEFILRVGGDQTANAFAMNSASEGEFTISFSESITSGTFEPGQLVRVQSDDTFRDTVTNEGEVNVIRSVDAANDEITLQQHLQADYTTSPEVRVLNDVENVTVEDLGFSFPDNTDRWRGLQVRSAVDVTVEGCWFYQCHESAVTLTDCFDSTVDDIFVKRSIRDGYGYGVSVSRATTYTTIKNSTFIEARHAITHGGSTIPGVPRHSETFNCNILQPNHDTGLDCHEECEHITFRDNTLNDCGVGIRGKDTRVIDNDIFLDGSNYAISISGVGVQMGIDIRGNRIERPGPFAIVAVGTDIRDADISHNEITGSGTGTTSNAAIGLLQVAEDTMIHSNQIQDCGVGIDIADSGANSATRQGLSVKGNNVKNCDTGYSMDGSGEYSDSIVADNISRGNTTDYDLTVLDSSCKVAHNIPNSTHDQ